MQNQKRQRDIPLALLLAADREFIESVMAEMPPVAFSWAMRLPPDKGAKVVQNAIRRTDGIIDEPTLGYFGNSALRAQVAAEAVLADVSDLHAGLLVIRAAAPSAVTAAIEAVRQGESADDVADVFFRRTSMARDGYFWVEDYPAVRAAIVAYLRSFKQ
jgi:hypothetical protein